MTPAEAQMLLGIAASFDNRKPSEEAATAWSVALDGLRFIDCRDAVIAHYRTSSEWLMPQKVISEVKRIRTKRIDDHGLIETPPGHDPDDVVGHQRWLRQARMAIADGEPIPSYAALKGENPMPPELASALETFGRLPADVEAATEAEA